MKLAQEEKITTLQRKVPLIALALFVFIFCIVWRLYELQVVQGEHYNKLASEIFVRAEEIVAKRGAITDRNGKVLAQTRTYFELAIIPQYVSDQKRVIENLARLLPLKKEAMLGALHKARFEPKFAPVVMADDIPYDWVARLKQHLAPEYNEKNEFDFSGVIVRDIPVREYLYPYMFAHALGYLREIDKQTLAESKDLQPGVFSLGDLMGAAGLEKAYDIELKGVDGILGRVVDARGREITSTEDLKVLQKQASVEPVAGYILRSTLDFKTQLAAFEAFEDKAGAVVAMDPNNGEIIALYSSPSFDANLITKKIDKEYWRKINLDEDKYLFNRSLQAMYPPASTYKVVGLTAGIDTGLIDPEKTTFRCSGGISFGGRFFKCWKRGGHGRVDALRAIAQSCDVFFYQLGIKLGVDKLAEYAHLFGFGKNTGIEIPFEKSGLIPTKEWKLRARKEKFYDSEMLSVVIGQSYNLTTPLQNVVSAALVGNGGIKVTPHLGQKILSNSGEVIRQIEYVPQKTKLYQSEGLKWAKQGMIEVVHGAGTATKLRKYPYKIAGKTGTAQVIGHNSNVKRGKKTENHALFISFAPYDDPKIAVAVIVEHGRGGSLAAAPIAGQVIEAYLGQNEK